MSEPKHTAKLPFRLTDIGRTGSRMILDGNGNYVANVQIYQTPRRMGEMDEPKREAHAECIVRACNAFPDLLEALKECVSQLHEVRTGTDFECECWTVAEKAEAAIAKAQPEETK